MTEIALRLFVLSQKREIGLVVIEFDMMPISLVVAVSALGAESTLVWFLGVVTRGTL